MYEVGHKTDSKMTRWPHSVLFLIPVFKAASNRVLQGCPVMLSVGRLWQVWERNFVSRASLIVSDRNVHHC